MSNNTAVELLSQNDFRLLLDRLKLLLDNLPEQRKDFQLSSPPGKTMGVKVAALSVG
jgi:hypothetical protein